MAKLSETAFWTAAHAAFTSSALELTILPTEQCNLRCSYCYERFELGRMSRPVVDSIKCLLARRAPELERLRIDWFGGEPLLALEIIEEIGLFAGELAGSKITYDGSITTNGVLLTADAAARLARAGVSRAHVSLDGPKQHHDLSRRLKGGQPTYERLMQNLTSIRDTDVAVRVDLRVHVTSENATDIGVFADELIDHFLVDDRFSIYFFPIVDLGGPNQGQFVVLDQARAAETVSRLTAKVQAARGLGAATPTSGCKSCYVCYAAKPNAWVIRSNGSLARCTVGFEDPRNHVGRLRRDGTMAIDQTRMKPWLRGWDTSDQLSLHCPYEEMRADVLSGAVSSRR